MPSNTKAEQDNPCLKEQKLSYKCLNDNNFDRDACELYFTNYNNCKEFWNRVKSSRRHQGIRPHLPDLADRPKIKEEYMKTKPNV